MKSIAALFSVSLSLVLVLGCAGEVGDADDDVSADPKPTVDVRTDGRTAPAALTIKPKKAPKFGAGPN